MDFTSEVVLWVTGLVIGFFLGWLTNWYFYRKQRKENEANSESIKQIRQFVGADIKTRNDKRGKLVEKPDGSIAIEWHQSLPSSVVVSATSKVEVKKKEE
jgi:hypothetical protein